MFRSKTETVREVRKILKAKKKLSPEDAARFWGNLVGNYSWVTGKQLVELLALAPHNLDEMGEQWALRVLQHIYNSKGSFDGVVGHMKKYATQNRRVYGIPVDLVKPLLADLEVKELVWVFFRDQELFDQSQDERLLLSMETQVNSAERSEMISKAIKRFPEFFERKRPEVLALITKTSDYLDNILPSLTGAERLTIFKNRLENVQFRTKKNGYYNEGAGAVQTLFSQAKKFLPDDEFKEFSEACKQRIEAYLKNHPRLDPIEAFLNEQYSWDEMVLAKADPDAFEKLKARGPSGWHGHWPLAFGIAGYPGS